VNEGANFGKSGIVKANEQMKKVQEDSKKDIRKTVM
jgi:hypothetical protein